MDKKKALIFGLALVLLLEIALATSTNPSSSSEDVFYKHRHLVRLAKR